MRRAWLDILALGVVALAAGALVGTLAAGLVELARLLGRGF